MSASAQVRRALEGNNRLTRTEISNLRTAGIGMDRILTVAGNQGSTIGAAAQRSFGIDQSRSGAISYTPRGPGPAPGSGWAVTGSQSYQVSNPQSGSTNMTAPTYTFMGAPKPSAGQGNPPIPGWPSMSQASNAGGPTAPSPASPQGSDVPGPMQSWLDSLGIGMSSIMDQLNKTIADNQAQQQQYGEMIANLAGQMSTANQQTFSGPYAVTTQNSVPVMGAQTTQAIGRRLKNPTTSLTISPETYNAGTGLNIPV